MKVTFLISIIVFMFIMPLPKYYDYDEFCRPCESTDNQDCPSTCHKKGDLIFSPSLLMNIMNTIRQIQPQALPEELDPAEGRFCGGIAANLPKNKCPEGYTCQLGSNIPDAGGKCIKIIE